MLLRQPLVISGVHHVVDLDFWLVVVVILSRALGSLFPVAATNIFRLLICVILLHSATAVPAIVLEPPVGDDLNRLFFLVEASGVAILPLRGIPIEPVDDLLLGAAALTRSGLHHV